MNRIILIGNGFDLAHGLKTSYKDFIYWYWDKFFEKSKKCYENEISDKLFKFIIKKEYTWSHLALNYEINNDVISGIAFLKYAKSNYKNSINFTLCPFMETILYSIETKGWVDIENLYYERLCKMMKEKNDEEVKTLNEQLSYISLLLREYLQKVKQSSNSNLFNEPIHSIIYSPIKHNEIAISAQNHWKEILENRYKSVDNAPAQHSKYFSTSLKGYKNIYEMNQLFFGFNNFKRENENQIHYMGFKSINPKYIPDCLRLPDRIMLLNFNYTNTAYQYVNNKSDIFNINHIHGELSNPDSIIFGYGDELDEQYKAILNLNDNNYLQNVKSIKYLETPNYRKMLDFIESDLFQVYILGHSCGNSDRTLLNTIFEHKNCVSIKPFYHQKDDGKDTYIDIIQNISRNFTDMKLMRDRVVNKTYCEPLPQNKSSAES